MRISDWSSDVCSSDLDIMRRQDDRDPALAQTAHHVPHVAAQLDIDPRGRFVEEQDLGFVAQRLGDHHAAFHAARQFHDLRIALIPQRERSEEHTSELQSLMRISYAVFCLKKIKSKTLTFPYRHIH